MIRVRLLIFAVFSLGTVIGAVLTAGGTTLDWPQVLVGSLAVGTYMVACTMFPSGDP